MKTILTAAAFFAVMAGTVYASGLTEPVMEPEVIVAEATQPTNLQIFAALAVIAIILGAASAF